MQMESDAERLSMLQALGAVSVSAPRGTLLAVFDEGYAEAALDIGVEGSQPFLTARTSDVERLAIGKGVMLTIGQRTFKSLRHEPDGTGISRVVLQS